MLGVPLREQHKGTLRARAGVRIDTLVGIEKERDRRTRGQELCEEGCLQRIQVLRLIHQKMGVHGLVDLAPGRCVL